MGTVMMFTNLGATNHPIAAPAKTASSELMMRLRSSTRCSKNVICPPPWSGAAGSLVVVSSWLSLVIGGLWARFSRVGICGGSFYYRRNRGLWRRYRLRQDSGRLGPGRCSEGCRLQFATGRSGRFLRFLELDFPRLPFDGPHLLFKRHLEVGGSLAEFCHHFAQTAGQFRQPMRSEDHQHHDEDDHQMWNAKHEWSAVAVLLLSGIIERV